MARQKKDTIQTAIRLDRELLKEIKMRSFLLNTSLQKWIMQAIVEKIIREDVTR